MGTIASISQGSSMERTRLLRDYKGKLKKNNDLNRKIVSFQANRDLPFYRWFKYKEAFSAELVSYVIKELKLTNGLMLDPFAGIGTSLFESRKHGLDTIGIEILPIGFFLISARLASEQVSKDMFDKELCKVSNIEWENYYDPEFELRHIPITKGAFSRKNERCIAGYRAYCEEKIKNPHVVKLFHLACLSILETISYTRKDGQYLRWDYRARKERLQSTFNKGYIPCFNEAINSKLNEISRDLARTQLQQRNLFEGRQDKPILGMLDLRRGSCLEILPEIEDSCVDLVITSPPYCNRYDYTRTYALELVYLGIDANELKGLRQSMLSCTVENKSKRMDIKCFYNRLNRTKDFNRVVSVFDNHKATREVINLLNEIGDNGQLNNSNIPKMISNYLLEMSFIIYELGRILKRTGKVFMVNDNVRYAGEEIPVDLILSDFARHFGIRTNIIWTLVRGKGNSSQQMGNHGRSELRKCVYFWEKE